MTKRCTDLHAGLGGRRDNLEPEGGGERFSTGVNLRSYGDLG